MAYLGDSAPGGLDDNPAMYEAEDSDLRDDVRRARPSQGEDPQVRPHAPRRLILEGIFLFQEKDTIYFFVNHWPSRRGGEEKSEPNRMKAAQTLRTRVENIFTNNPNSNIIIVGDFNDEPTNVSITEYLKAEPFFCDSLDHENLPEIFGTDLFNLSYKAWFDGEGSYKYKDDFNMLDQIMISKEILLGDNILYVCNSYEVYKPEIMVTRTGKFQGAPFPTYGGARYLGGYSDHFPVIAKFIFRGK